MSTIQSQHIEQAMSYEAYIALSEKLFTEGKTTGPKQSESLLHYTGMNLRRMKRISKTVKLDPATIEAVNQIDTAQTWLVLTEAWCGDAAQILPVIQAMADSNPLIDLKILLRDENLDVMDAYLTNGARSIPKLIILRASDLAELGQWGPRPKDAQALVMAHKAEPSRPYEELSKELQQWYNRDKAQHTQAEIVSELSDLSTSN